MEKKTESEIEKIVLEAIKTTGEPAEIAESIDDVIFDWLDDAMCESSNVVGEWYQERMIVLKRVRDMFTQIGSLSK